MLTYKKDDFDENMEDIMNSINGILNKKKTIEDKNLKEEEKKENKK